MAKYCKRTSLWQIAATICHCHKGKMMKTHIVVTMTNCCRHASICLYSKLLQVYINMYLWQIAADIHHFHKLLYIIQYTYIIVYIANCWKHISLHHCGSLPTPQCYSYSVTMAVCAAASIYLHCQCYIVTYTARIILLRTMPAFYTLLNSYIHWDRRGRRPQSWWRRYCSAWPGWRPPDKTCPRQTWPQNCWHGTCTHSLITVLVHSLSCHCTCTHSLITLLVHLSLIHIWRCRRFGLCRSRWSPYH